MADLAAASSASCPTAAKTRHRGPTHSRQDPEVIAGEVAQICRIELQACEQALAVQIAQTPSSCRLGGRAALRARGRAISGSSEGTVSRTSVCAGPGRGEQTRKLDLNRRTPPLRPSRTALPLRATRRWTVVAHGRARLLTRTRRSRPAPCPASALSTSRPRRCLRRAVARRPPRPHRRVLFARRRRPSRPDRLTTSSWTLWRSRSARWTRRAARS